MNASARATSTRSPVLAIAGSLVAGLVLAFALVLGPAAGGSEALVTGSVLLTFGLGWGLMALLTTRFSAQPQRWMLMPAAALGITGFLLVVIQPGPAAMDLLSWIWPPAIVVLGIWMLLQVRAQLRGRGRWLIIPTTAVLLLFAVGGGLETIMAAMAPSSVGAGQLVDVGGHRLYIACTGAGSPTVVLESGLSESSAYWARIAPEVAASSRVCVYDRAGRGHSEAAAGPVDGVVAANDLHALLAGSGNPGPYVMVGHSSGGVYVRVFAATYPTEVVGMVLLDSQPSDAFTALPSFPGFHKMFRVVSALEQPIARLGLLRLGTALLAPTILPAAAQAQEIADQSSARFASSQRDEFAALEDALRESLALTTFGARPLVVVEAGKDAEVGWHEAQLRLAALSTNSSYRFQPDTTHVLLIAGETESRAAVSAILDVLVAVRTGTALRAG